MRSEKLKVKSLFLVILLGLLLFPQVSLAARTYTACKKGYVGTNGKCCPKDYPYYCGHPFDDCCREEDCSACTHNGDPEDLKTVTYEGLVPCGRKLTVNSGTMDVPCQLCHFFVMLDAILDFVITMAFIVAVLMLVFAGFILIIGKAIPGEISPVKIEMAWSIIGSVATGLIIIFAAWIIVNTIFVFLGVSEWAGEFTGPGAWFQINCPIELPQ